MRYDDDKDASTVDSSLQSEAMIRAEWTRPMSKACLPKGSQELASTRKVSDLVTECVWIVNSKQAYVTLEPDGTAIKSYKTEFDIKQAFWHRFPSSASLGLNNGDSGDELDCLCLVGEEAIDMYATTDDHYYTCTVPFKITGVHQSSHGLLLERAQRDKKLFTPPPDYFMPRLFSLSHPYDEALPMLCSQKGQSRLVYCWEGDAEVEVVGTSADLVLVFDPVASAHRLYAMRSNEAIENMKPGNGAIQQLATPRINPDQGVITHTPTFTAVPPPVAAPATGGRRTVVAPPSALQQSATRRRMRSLLAGPLASPITPVMHGGLGAGVGHGGVPFSAKFTPNRSLQSMGESSPFVRLARLPTTSTPRGGVNVGAAATPVLQQQGTAAQLTKRPLSGLFCAPEEDESLISSVWMELLWTEKDPNQRASKFFVSHDMNMVPFVNWLVGDQLAVMKVALPNTHRIPTLICPPGSQPTFIQTAGADYIESSRLTATVSPDQSSIVMYSGPHKAAVLVLKMPLVSPARFRLLCAADRTMALSTMSGDVLHVRIPALFRSQFAARIWDSLCDTLATTPDKMAKLLVAWTTANKEMESDAPDEVAALSRLVMEHTGVSVEELSPEIEQEIDSSLLDDDDDDDLVQAEVEVVYTERAAEELPDEEECSRILALMKNSQRRTVTVMKLQKIYDKGKSFESIKKVPILPTETEPPMDTSASAASESGDSIGEKRKSEEKTGEDTVGAKQSRSEEGLEEDEKWRLVCDVLQSTTGAFPNPPQVLKDPLRSAGARLRTTSTVETDDGGKGEEEEERSATRRELTARTPSPLYPWAKTEDTYGEPSAAMSRFYRVAELCRRAREMAAAEVAAAAVKRRRRRVLLTDGEEGAAPLAPIAPLVFQALHLSYEESKMHMAEYEVLRVLALHLFIFARWRSFSAYANYYARDFPYLREIKVLSRPSVDGRMQPLQQLQQEGEGEREAEEESKQEIVQATSWDRCRRTPGERRGGGAYGGLLQLRRAAHHAAAAAAGAVTPTTASLFTPPTGAARGQVLQPPAVAALAAFSPTAVPSVGEYLCSLLHLAGHTSSMSIYESFMCPMSPASTIDELDMAGTSRERVSLAPNEEVLHQLLQDRVRGKRRTADPSYSSPSIDMNTPSMLCSPLPPQVASGSYSTAPPASPLASGIFIAAGVGLGLVRSTGDLVRMLSINWARRLRLNHEGQRALQEAVNDDKDDDMTRCDRVFAALGWTRETVANLNPAMKVLVSMITNKSKPLKPAMFFGKVEMPPKLSDFPTPFETAQLLRRRWPHDQRTENVVMMMESFRPIYIPIVAKPPVMQTPGNYDTSASDADSREKQEAFLSMVNYRTLSQSFGRAIMHFRTVLPVPNNSLHVRDICLSGRIHPTNQPIDVPASDNTKLLRDWGDFYQGVAVGLTVAPADVMETDSEWLTQTHGQEKPCIMNGLLYAFGLNGHIKSLNMFYVHEHLTNQDKMTSIALLLGLSAAHIGTGDLQIHKILVTHLPFLMGPTLLEIHVDGLLQTAAVAGLGLLFTGSCRTTLIDHLINEMGREQDLESEPSTDRYSYGLSCGFSIGLIGLGQGDDIAINNVPLAQTMRAVSDRLIVLMNGGLRSDCVFMSSGGDMQSSIGMNGLLPEQLSTTTGASGSGVMQQQQHNQAHSGHHPGMGGLPPPSSHIKEDPDHVNVHVTGHGATIALGLLFMKTGNRHIARELSLPNTVYELEGIRPDLLSVRVLAKALVEWEEIAPSDEWLKKQIPDVIKNYEAHVIRMQDELFAPTREEKEYWERIIDRETVAQTYLYSMAGGLFAMALKWPSTSHPTIARLLHEWVEVLMPKREDVPNINKDHSKRESFSRICRLAGQSCVSDCLDQVVLALAILHAGSGDLDALRVFRALRMGGGGEMLFQFRDPLRWAGETGPMHAQQSTAHTAMGLLFAGAGRCGLKCDDRSIALLIIALYPISCRHIADNKMYLQPLRFLWALCVEPRVLYSVSTSNGQPTRHSVKYEWRLEKAKRRDTDAEGNEILVDIENTHNGVMPVTSKVPVVLPPLDMLSRVTVGGDAIDSIRFDLSIPSDRAALERILRVQHGRVAHRAIDAQSHMVESALSACSAHSLTALAPNPNRPDRLFFPSAIHTPTRRSADDRWTERTSKLVPDRDELNKWVSTFTPSSSDPLHLCDEGPIAVHATAEISDLTYRWSLNMGSFDAQSQVLSVYKRLLTEDMSESALAYNEATMLCRILEGKKNVNFHDLRLVSMVDEVVVRKVAEAKPRNLASKNYRLKSKDCVDPTLFQIVQ
ncbi:hypothetical protein PFISCL1PPCAC_4975 [Pristionchus fissidentatus]|uniref:Anaphase-promoting complex subunit 1 n=1 Tax=Pristionchus fissidentatus TaxID=1538716 RepID=A0AAV5V5X1_9BILA|nr:hypothetical protein PFISCL1PPCAC_4975 [Pristionchus fissidentatus]